MALRIALVKRAPRQKRPMPNRREWMPTPNEPLLHRINVPRIHYGAGDFSLMWVLPGAADLMQRVEAASLAAGTVSVCFSKAHGAPVGSCLAGPEEFIARARRFKQQFGGGFRQAGIIAAGALYVLEHHRTRLGEICLRAANVARKISSYPEIDIDPATVETNIARFRLRGVSFISRFVAVRAHVDCVCACTDTAE